MGEPKVNVPGTVAEAKARSRAVGTAVPRTRRTEQIQVQLQPDSPYGTLANEVEEYGSFDYYDRQEDSAYRTAAGLRRQNQGLQPQHKGDGRGTGIAKGIRSGAARWIENRAEQRAEGRRGAFQDELAGLMKDKAKPEDLINSQNKEIRQLGLLAQLAERRNERKAAQEEAKRLRGIEDDKAALKHSRDDLKKRKDAEELEDMATPDDIAAYAGMLNPEQAERLKQFGQGKTVKQVADFVSDTQASVHAKVAESHARAKSIKTALEVRARQIGATKNHTAQTKFPSQKITNETTTQINYFETLAGRIEREIQEGSLERYFGTPAGMAAATNAIKTVSARQALKTGMRLEPREEADINALIQMSKATDPVRYYFDKMRGRDRTKVAPLIVEELRREVDILKAVHFGVLDTRKPAAWYPRGVLESNNIFLPTREELTAKRDEFKAQGKTREDWRNYMEGIMFQHKKLLKKDQDQPAITGAQVDDIMGGMMKNLTGGLD